MSSLNRFFGAMTIAALVLAALFGAWAFFSAKQQDLPWTPLDLGEAPGAFTGRKLTALGEDFAQCRALLDRAGVRFTVLEPLRDGQCGYDDGIRLGGGSRSIAFAPRGLGTTCSMAASLAVLEWQVVQPAAREHFDSPVVRIDHYGSYNCRRMYGRSTGDWSEHARANAVDIAGFVLADGTRVSVLRDWNGPAKKAAFLRDVRDGACKLFATVLSPEYNAAHRDHFHLDQAARGAMGWRACR